MLRIFGCVPCIWHTCRRGYHTYPFCITFTIFVAVVYIFVNKAPFFCITQLFTDDKTSRNTRVKSDDIHVHGMSKDQLQGDRVLENTQKMSGELAKWMEYLPSSVVQDVQLKDLAIPGSHDSATFDLDPHGGRADDFSSDLELQDDKIQKWFTTQKLDFYDQLKHGIRYFDLRIIKERSSGTVRFVHGLFSRETVPHYLKDIRKFLDENQKEVVILDFNHIYDMQKEDHLSFCTEMENVFSGIMLNKNKCSERGLAPHRMTLSQFWDLNGRVLILYKKSVGCRNHQHIWSRNDIDILWPYTPNKDLVVKNLQDDYNRLHRKDQFIVAHGILTPHSDDNFAGRINHFKDLHEFVSPIIAVIVEWIRSRPKMTLNICCADFIEEPDFVTTVIKANSDK